MTKPEEITQEDWDKAFYWMDDGGFIAAFYTDEDGEALQRTIARAIMAAKADERRICYNQAISELLSGESEDENDKSYDRGVRDAANAIRNRDTV